MTYSYLPISFELIHNIYNSQLTLFCAVVIIIIVNIISTLVFVYILLRRFASCCTGYVVQNIEYVMLYCIA